MTGRDSDQPMSEPDAQGAGCVPTKWKVGILAYGSLITDPGEEINPRIVKRMKCETPFTVEYGRLSRTRGGAPTLVPHEKGGSVSAEILVLDDSISEDEVRDLLWRRETRNEGRTLNYPGGTSPDSVLVVGFHDDPRIETVLYTDFNCSGKISNPSAADLARAAIESVGKASSDRDGITYLMHAVESGIETPLTRSYLDSILSQTGTRSLVEARDFAKTLNSSHVRQT